MPEYVGLQSETPDIFGKLSQLLQIKQQQQGLRTATAEAQSAEQSAAQRKAIAAYDFGKHTDEDGLPDVLSMALDPELHAAAGDQFQEVLHHAAAQRQAQIGNIQTLTTLRTDQRKALADITTGLRSDPDVAEDNEKGRQKVNDALIQYGETYGDAALPVLRAYAPNIVGVPKGKMQQYLATLGMQTTSADRQIEMQGPQYQNIGGKLKNINPVVAPGTAPDLSVTLPPGAVLVSDANDRQFVLNPQTNRVTPVGTGGTGGGGPSPKAAPGEPTRRTKPQPTFTQAVPGQKDLETHIADVRKADSDYGQNQHVNDELIRLSKDTSTGPGSSLWHTGAIGKITGTFGGNAAADYQKIGAYLDRQAAMSATQMGLPETNAGLQTAANLSGTTEYVPEALRTKVNLTSAMVEGAHQYRKGLDKVIGTGPNQDLTNLQAYRSQWADNFDPNVFRAENAIRRKDKEELAAIKQEVGADGMRDLKRKSDNLRKLERGELLP